MTFPTPIPPVPGAADIAKGLIATKEQVAMERQLPGWMRHHVNQFRERVKRCDKAKNNRQITDAQLAIYFTLHYMIMAQETTTDATKPATH